jgi:hypothetical protein
VRWFHPHRKPHFTRASYEFKLPDDLPDGEYSLTVGSGTDHLASLRTEKPHLFSAETLPEVLAVLNRMGAHPENRLYVRLGLNRGGLAVNHMEMPDLPSFRRVIMEASEHSNITPYSEALVEYHEMDFAVKGTKLLAIKIDRRADQ